MTRARVVHGDRTFVYNMSLQPTTTERGWWAWHDDCGWSDFMTQWHNAFWAADHHVRHDCGRREPSSGHDGQSYALMQVIDMGSLHGLKPGQPWIEEQWDISPQEHVGGRSNPPGSEFAEGPTAEMGAITAEVGYVPGEDDPWQGLPMEDRAGKGWWQVLWGRGHGG